MRACTVSSACVRPGGPVKVMRVMKKSSSVSLDLAGTTAPRPLVQSVALVPIEPGPSAAVGADKRGHQVSRASANRKLETAKKKQKQDQKILDVVAPFAQEIKTRDETIAALRRELAQVRASEAAAAAAVAADNWRDGVAAGRSGWGPVPTPRTSNRVRPL